MREVENQMRETLRIKLGQRGINLDNMVLMEDFDILSYNFDEDEDASSAGSDSSGDDGLPLHLERFGKVNTLFLFQLLFIDSLVVSSYSLMGG